MNEEFEERDFRFENKFIIPAPIKTYYCFLCGKPLKKRIIRWRAKVYCEKCKMIFKVLWVKKWNKNRK